MKLMNKAVVILLLIMTSCVQVPSAKNETIDELIIRNETNSELVDVALRVPDQHILVSVNLILPNREYSLGFRNLENQRDDAILSWVHRQRSYTRRIDTPIPKIINHELIYRVIITVSDNGQISSRLEPHPEHLN